MEWFKNIVKVNQKPKRGRKLNYGDISEVILPNKFLKIAWQNYVECILEITPIDDNKSIDNDSLSYTEESIYHAINLKEFQNYLKAFKKVFHDANILYSEANYKYLHNKFEIDNSNNKENEDVFYFINDYFDKEFDEIHSKEKESENKNNLNDPTPVIEIRINDETHCFTETNSNVKLNDNKINEELLLLYKDYPVTAIYEVLKKLELLTTVKHLNVNRNIINLLIHILILSLFEDNRKKLIEMDILSIMQTLFDNIITKYFNSDSIFHNIINNNNANNSNINSNHLNNNGENGLLYECVIYILAIFIKYNNNNQPWKKYIENWKPENNNQDNINVHSSISFKQKQQLIKSLLRLLIDINHYQGIIINRPDRQISKLNLSDKQLSRSPMSSELEGLTHSREPSTDRNSYDVNGSVGESSDFSHESYISTSYMDEIQRSYIIKMLSFSLIGEMLFVNSGLVLTFDQHEGFQLLLDYIKWPYFLKKEDKKILNIQYNPHLMEYVQYEFHTQILSWRLINYLISIDMQKYGKKLEVSSKTVNPLTILLEWTDFVTDIRTKYGFGSSSSLNSSDESLKYQNISFSTMMMPNFKSFISASSSDSSHINLFSGTKSCGYSVQTFQFYPKNLLFFPEQYCNNDENSKMINDNTKSTDTQSLPIPFSNLVSSFKNSLQNGLNLSSPVTNNSTGGEDVGSTKYSSLLTTSNQFKPPTYGNETSSVTSQKSMENEINENKDLNVVSDHTTNEYTSPTPSLTSVSSLSSLSDLTTSSNVDGKLSTSNSQVDTTSSITHRREQLNNYANFLPNFDYIDKLLQFHQEFNENITKKKYLDHKKKVDPTMSLFRKYSTNLLNIPIFSIIDKKYYFMAILFQQIYLSFILSPNPKTSILSLELNMYSNEDTQEKTDHLYWKYIITTLIGFTLNKNSNVQTKINHMNLQRSIDSLAKGSTRSTILSDDTDDGISPTQKMLTIHFFFNILKLDHHKNFYTGNDTSVTPESRHKMCLTLCEDLRIWDVLFSDIFYLRKPIIRITINDISNSALGDAITKPYDLSIVEKNDDTKKKKNQEYISILSGAPVDSFVSSCQSASDIVKTKTEDILMSELILNLVVYLATLPLQDHSNISICRKLISVIGFSDDNYIDLKDVVYALLKIIYHQKIKTQQALCQIDCLKVLIPVFTNILKETKKNKDSSYQVSNSIFSKGFQQQVLDMQNKMESIKWTLLLLLDYFFTGDNSITSYILSDSNTMDMLFNFLNDDSYSDILFHFAIHHILKLFEAVSLDVLVSTTRYFYNIDSSMIESIKSYLVANQEEELIANGVKTSTNNTTNTEPKNKTLKTLTSRFSIVNMKTHNNPGNVTSPGIHVSTDNLVVMNNEYYEHLIYYLINKYINIIPTTFTTYNQYKKIIDLLNGIQKLLRQFQLYHTRGRIIQIILMESGLLNRLEAILNYPFSISKEELNSILQTFSCRSTKSENSTNYNTINTPTSLKKQLFKAASSQSENNAELMEKKVTERDKNIDLTVSKLKPPSFENEDEDEDDGLGSKLTITAKNFEEEKGVNIDDETNRSDMDEISNIEIISVHTNDNISNVANKSDVTSSEDEKLKINEEGKENKADDNFEMSQEEEENNEMENEHTIRGKIPNDLLNQVERVMIKEPAKEDTKAINNKVSDPNVYIKKILSSVIKTITALLSGNNYLKQIFKYSYNGYEKIYQYITKYEEFDGSITYLFGMLVENDSWIENTPAVIRNIDVLPIIVKTYKNANFESKNFIIDQMQKLSEIHEINTMKLSHASFVGMILNEILPNVNNQVMLNKITKLIYTIATFSISIPEAKQMFKMLRQIDVMNEKRINEENKERVMARSQLNGWDILMKNKNSKLKPKEKEISMDNLETDSENAPENEEDKLLLPFYYDNLIQVLYEIMKTKNRDSDFFYFSGLNSGIYIPELKEWPTSEGYTIMTWIKVESFDIEEISSGVTNTKYMNVTKKGKVIIKNNKVTNIHDYDYQNQYCPRIFSFTSRGKNNRNTNGLDLFFIDNKIYIGVTRDGKTETYSISEQFEFLPNKWYHVALVHEAPKLWGNNSDLNLFIDGRLNKTTKVKYPKNCNYQQSYIGCKGRTGTFSEISIQDVYQSFCGQMVSFNIFNCILHEYNLAAIHALGIDQESELDSIVYSESFLSKYSEYLEPEEFSSLFLCYHPKASETDNIDSEESYDSDSLDDDDHKKANILNILFNKKYGKDYYSAFNFEKEDTYKLYYYLFKIFNANSVDIINNLQINVNSTNVNHAYLFSVSRTSTKCLRNTLHSLGGINVLLPLLLHSNLNRINFEPNPLETANKKELLDEFSKTVTKLDPDQSSERLITFIRIIAHLIISDSFHQNTVKTSYFLPIMNYLLYNYVNYSYISIELFELIEYFAEHINDEAIIFDIMNSLLFNPKLWAMASINVQIYYYTAIQKYIKMHYIFCKEHFGVSHFLKILEKHYYYIPIKENRTSNYVNNIDDLKIIRKLILNIITDFIKDDSTYEEIEAILNTFILDIDYQHSAELLQILKNLIIVDNDRNIINNIVKYDHLNFFIKLIRNSDSECRMDSLKIINYMLRLNTISDKWKEKLHNSAILLIQSLEEFPVTSEVCYLLFEMCMEEDIGDGSNDFLYMSLRDLRNTDIKNIKVLEFLIYLISNQNTKNTCSQSILPDDLKMDLTFTEEEEEEEFSNSAINEEIEKDFEPEKEEKDDKTIDESTAKPTSIHGDDKEKQEKHEMSENISIKRDQSFINEFEVLKVKFLEDLFFLFNINESNCIAFMKDTEWPKLLISLIPEGAFNKYKNEVNYKEDANTNIIENMIIEIFYLLLDSSFENSKSWQELYTIIFFYFTVNIEDSFIGVKEILKRYLQKINGGLLKTKVYSFVKYDNIIHLIHFAEEWLFNHTDFKEIFCKLKNVEPNVSKSFFDIPLFDSRVLKMPSKSVVTNESLNVSYPWEESRESCEILINSLLSIINAKKTLPANILSKVFTKNDGLLKTLFRFLNSGLGIYNKDIWTFIISIYQLLLNENVELKLDSSLCYSTLGHLMNALEMCNQEIKKEEERKMFYDKLLNINYEFTNLWWPVIITMKPPINDGFISKQSITMDDFTLMMEKEIQNCNDMIYQPAIRTFDESCYSMIFDSCRNFEKIVGQIMVNIRKKSEENEKKELLRIKKEDENMLEFKDDQIERIIKARAKDDNRNRFIEKKWNTLIHEMSRDRGLWFFETGSTLTWKLDYTENINRIRRRLIPNYEFEDHLDASFKRDRIKNDSQDMFLKIPKTAEKKKSKFEKLREKYSNETGNINNIERHNSNSTALASNPLEDDLTESDKWSILTGNEELSSGHSLNTDDEKVIFKADCDLIMLTTTISGYLLLTSKNLYFYLNPLAVVTNITNSGQEGTISSPIIENELLRDRQWKLEEIADIYIRRYLLKRSALEIFFTDHTNIFFNFHISKESFKFFRKLINLHPVNLKFKESANPSEIFKKYHNITEMWQNRKISNFDYLMFLNTISGRTFNDLTQYPVFPW